jgi:hypothetical protein
MHDLRGCIVFDLNRRNPSEIDDEGSVSEPLVHFTPTPEGFTDLQSRFVDAFVQMGGKGELAAIEAGYSPITAGNMAVRNLSQPKIVALLNERLKVQGPVALAIAIGALLRIAEKSDDDRAVVQAAVALCDRFGLSVPKGPLVAIQNNNGMTGEAAQRLLEEVAMARALRLRDDRNAAIDAANELKASAIDGAIADRSQRQLATLTPPAQPAVVARPRPAAAPPDGGGMFD